MLAVLRAARALRPAPRRHSSAPAAAAADLAARLQADLKAALKARDAPVATTIRSVLADVYAAQKSAAPAALPPADVAAIVRKAELRRLESARQFAAAARPDLAQQEQAEARLLAAYLPPRLSEAQVDALLRDLIAQPADTTAAAATTPERAKSACLKAFYARVGRGAVDAAVVRRRLDELWPPS